MYLAVRYAKKKYGERQKRKATSSQDAEEFPLRTTPTSPTAVGADVLPTQEDHGPASSIHGSEDGAREQQRVKEKAERKKRQRAYRYRIIFGLMMPFTLQALDTTIIASALPTIAADFDQLPQLNWIISSFNLTAAAFLPFWAQLADIFGRHFTLHASIAIISIGSALCTAAPTSSSPSSLEAGFAVLLLGRALQGVGAAGINICVRVILADRVSLAEYAKNWTLFAVFSAVGFALGPVAGGYLTSRSTWRWCFGINLPVAAVAVVLVVVLLRGELVGPRDLDDDFGGENGGRVGKGQRLKRFGKRLATVDFGGQMLFLWGIGLVVLALTWAGKRYAWDSAGVLAPLVIGGVLTGVWVWYERAMVPGRVMARVFPRQRAMMPWGLMVQRDMALLFVVNFVMGVAMFAVMYFMDLYFSLVLGHSPKDAGLALLYFLPGLGAGTFSATFFSNVWPRQTQPTLLFAATTASVGITVMVWATETQNEPLIYGMMALTGFGVGLSFNPGSLHALAYFPDMTAPIQCLVSFANPFGGTVGLTLMSTVFNNKSGEGAADPKAGIVWAFVAVVPIMWMSVVMTLLLGNVWILPGEGGHDIVDGVWLWSLVRGKPLERRRVMVLDPVQGHGQGVFVGENGSARAGDTIDRQDSAVVRQEMV